MEKCPKCKRAYRQNGKQKKTKHHVIPQRLWKNVSMDERNRKSLDEYTIDICRNCHDNLNRFIEYWERGVLFQHYANRYSHVLASFLKGADDHG